MELEIYLLYTIRISGTLSMSNNMWCRFFHSVFYFVPDSPTVYHNTRLMFVIFFFFHTLSLSLSSNRLCHFYPLFYFLHDCPVLHFVTFYLLYIVYALIIVSLFHFPYFSLAYLICVRVFLSVKYDNLFLVSFLK